MDVDPPSGQLIGTIIDAHGCSVEQTGILVRVGQRGPTVARATTGDDGRYRIRQLTPRNDYFVTATPPEGTQITIGPISVDSARTTTINLPVGPLDGCGVRVDGGRSLATLRGRIADAGGGPVENARVAVLRGTPGRLVASACTDPHGEYDVLLLQPGTDYRVVVRRSGYEAQSVDPIRLEAGTVTVRDVTLSARTDLPASPSPR